jgi:hypothetical protein
MYQRVIGPSARAIVDRVAPAIRVATSAIYFDLESFIKNICILHFRSSFFSRSGPFQADWRSMTRNGVCRGRPSASCGNSLRRTPRTDAVPKERLLPGSESVACLSEVTMLPDNGFVLQLFLPGWMLLRTPKAGRATLRRRRVTGIARPPMGGASPARPFSGTGHYRVS